MKHFVICLLGTCISVKLLILIVVPWAWGVRERGRHESILLFWCRSRKNFFELVPFGAGCTCGHIIVVKTLSFWDVNAFYDFDYYFLGQAAIVRINYHCSENAQFLQTWKHFITLITSWGRMQLCAWTIIVVKTLSFCRHRSLAVAPSNATTTAWDATTTTPATTSPAAILHAEDLAEVGVADVEVGVKDNAETTGWVDEIFPSYFGLVLRVNFTMFCDQNCCINMVGIHEFWWS